MPTSHNFTYLGLVGVIWEDQGVFAELLLHAPNTQWKWQDDSASTALMVF
jgi:hypothetical protein